MRIRTTGRRGGRVARRKNRAATLPEELQPVRPGQKGGRFLPLSEENVQSIHGEVLRVLENIGFADAIPSCIDAMKAKGCLLSAENRLLIPRSVVRETLEQASRDIKLYAQSPKYDLHLSGNKIHFGTAGAAVHIVDPHNRLYRDSTVKDLYDLARLCDHLDHIHFFQRPIVCRDLEDPREMDFNTLYACICGTSKHVGTSFVKPSHLEDALRMLHIVAGSEEKWRKQPFVSMSNCFVIPPLKFAEDACRCLEIGVYGGMPILLLSAGQAGATAPAALAGAVVQSIAEVLGGLVYVNALIPGAPAIFGTWPFVSDLRTGAMSGGSGEQAILMAACAQMGRFYDLPIGIAAGMTDSKLPDAQSGYEKAYTVALAAHSGANLVYESAGMCASLLGCCPESYVIDNDMIGAINRTVLGIEVNSESLGFETIQQVCTEGPGHYLGHEQTLARMQSDYLYPDIGDRENITNWIEQGATDILERAKKKTQVILESHYPRHINEKTDLLIRKNFPVRFDKGGGNPKPIVT